MADSFTADSAFETKGGDRYSAHDCATRSMVARAPLCFTHQSPRAFRMVVQFGAVCWELN